MKRMWEKVKETWREFWFVYEDEEDSTQHLSRSDKQSIWCGSFLMCAFTAVLCMAGIAIGNIRNNRQYEQDVEETLNMIATYFATATEDEYDEIAQTIRHDLVFSEYGRDIFKTGKRPPNNWRSVFGGSVWEKVPGRDEYYFHSFGKKQPDFNWENPALRRELYKMVNGWLDKGIAGFRVDAINFIKKDQTWADREPDGADGLAKCTKACRNQPGLGAFLAELRRETFDRHDCVTVAETAGVPYDKLGAFIGEDGYFSMVFDFHYADLDIASGSEWFKRIPWTIPDLNEKIMRSQTALQQCGWAANFIENHDQPRATTKYLGAAQNDPDAVKTLGAMYFFLRGTPFIYQGQELGMVNFARTSPAQFDDISSIDQYDRAIQEGLTAEQALHIVDLRSRDNARTPFPWTAEQYGGFSQAKPWLAMTEEFPACNAAAQQKDSASVLAFYREMIRFRQEGPCSRTLIWGDITPVASSPDVIAYRRAYEGEEVWCWFNFGAAPAREAIPAGLEPVWGDTAAVQDGALVLPPHRFVLMRRTVR